MPCVHRPAEFSARWRRKLEIGLNREKERITFTFSQEKGEGGGEKLKKKGGSGKVEGE